MVVVMQRTKDRLMAACTRYSGDDLDTEAIHPSRRRTKKKRQQIRIKLMVAGTQHANFSLRAKTNFYLKRAQQMGKILITANTQRTDSGLMVVSQRTIMPRVVTKQQTNTCSQVIRVQRTDSSLMAVLQQTAMPRVVANRWTYLTQQATSVQRANSGLIVVCNG